MFCFHLEPHNGNVLKKTENRDRQIQRVGEIDREWDEIMWHLMRAAHKHNKLAFKIQSTLHPLAQLAKYTNVTIHEAGTFMVCLRLLWKKTNKEDTQITLSKRFKEHVGLFFWLWLTASSIHQCTITVCVCARTTIVNWSKSSWTN